MRNWVVVAVAILAGAVEAASPTKQECKSIISAEKKPMDACVEKKCRRLAAVDMGRFQACFDRCATEQSRPFAACYKALLAEVEEGGR